MQRESGPTGGPTPAAESSHGGAQAAEHDAELHLPAPSIWPIACAAGIGLLGFGVLTSLVFSTVGLLLIGWSLAGWIREMLDE